MRPLIRTPAPSSPQVEKLPCLMTWKSSYTLETVLSELRKWVIAGVGSLASWPRRASFLASPPLILPDTPRTPIPTCTREMASPANRKLSQPAEGTCF
jgi:hypothetical protein